jgi:hypothetical protein
MAAGLENEDKAAISPTHRRVIVSARERTTTFHWAAPRNRR